ncbi:MAG: hypothetical protein H6Q70_2119 [Firmicutes bacterium]|nr:hypothetical protein [Bacillota bacterium]
MIDKIDLWRLVRNRLIHDVGICKSKDEASMIHEKLGLEIEETQLRIMTQKTICEEMIMTCDKFLHNIFRQNVFKDMNW